MKSFTDHPAAIPHGPHPRTVEASMALDDPAHPFSCVPPEDAAGPRPCYGDGAADMNARPASTGCGSGLASAPSTPVVERNDSTSPVAPPYGITDGSFSGRQTATTVVLGKVRGSEDPARDPERSVAAGTRKDGGRLPLAPLGLLYEVAIHSLRPLGAGDWPGRVLVPCPRSDVRTASARGKAPTLRPGR